MLDDISLIWRYLATRSDPCESDAIFCFGSAHLGTARKAAELYHLGISPYVLVTGGPAGSVGSHRTEADGFEHVLVTAGVPSSVIITERTARHTGENVELGMSELIRRGVKVSSLTVVAFPTAVRRSVATIRRHFPALEIHAVPAFEGLGLFEGDLEAAARMALGEFDRLTAYPSYGHIAPVLVPREIVDAAHRIRRRTALPRLLTDMVSVGSTNDASMVSREADG